MSRSLCGVYFFAAWGDRMWEFSVIVFLLEVFPGTLLPPSLFGLFENIAGIAFGTTVGDYIDSTGRLQSMRTSIWGQNVAVCIASLAFSWILANHAHSSHNLKIGVFAFIVLAGMVARVSSSMNKICVHKVWAVAMVDGDKNAQAKLNSQLRRVDLICSILAPLSVGLLVLFLSPSGTCILIAGWACCSFAVEWYLSNWFYNRVTKLQEPRQRKEDNSTEKPSCISRQLSNLYHFRNHPAFWASVPYCLLYASALSFGGIMISFLRTIGVETVYLAVGRAIAAACAIASTFAVPRMIASVGMVTTGVRTIWIQVACLAPLAAAFLMFHDRAEQSQVWFIALLFATVCASRFGLWGFDLAQTQLMQTLIEKDKAGVVNGAQETLVNVCWLSSFCITIIFHDPAYFIGPVLASFSAIFIAAIVFSLKASFIEESLTAKDKLSIPRTQETEEPCHPDALEELPSDVESR